MEVSADTIKTIRELCEDIMARDGFAQSLTLWAVAILAALDMQEKRHGAANPPG